MSRRIARIKKDSDDEQSEEEKVLPIKAKKSTANDHETDEKVPAPVAIAAPSRPHNSDSDSDEESADEEDTETTADMKKRLQKLVNDMETKKKVSKSPKQHETPEESEEEEQPPAVPTKKKRKKPVESSSWGKTIATTCITSTIGLLFTGLVIPMLTQKLAPPKPSQDSMFPQQPMFSSQFPGGLGQFGMQPGLFPS